MRSVAPRNLSEDHYASTLEPSLGGFDVANLQRFESQTRGFAHGHRTINSIPTMQDEKVLDMFANKQSGLAREFLACLEDQLLARAASLHYDGSALPSPKSCRKSLRRISNANRS